MNNVETIKYVLNYLLENGIYPEEGQYVGGSSLEFAISVDKLATTISTDMEIEEMEKEYGGD